MKERPILFSSPMVRALLAGTKTQTRRIVTPERPGSAGLGSMDIQIQLENWIRRAAARCRQGQPGSRLWVKETWATEKQHDALPPSELPTTSRLYFVADGPKPEWAGKTRVSVHMTRWASRIDLEVTGVRVERLQAISEADAIAEGIYQVQFGSLGHAEWGASADSSLWRPDPISAYRALWENINGPGSWAANPWVWVVELKRVAP